MKFRLLRGQHIEKVGYDGSKRVDRVYQVTRDPKDASLRVHPIIESDKDLCALFNSPDGNPKFRKFEKITEATETIVHINPFERIPGETIQNYMNRLNDLQAQAKAEVELRLKEVDGMGKEELEDFAEAEEIDTKNAKTAEQLRMIIKSALKG
jgi:hypothetical protein